MKCELNLVDVNLDTMAQPEWWPQDVMFGEKLLSQVGLGFGWILVYSCQCFRSRRSSGDDTVSC